jgi:peptide/nickel transport system ATP-binding protein
VVEVRNLTVEFRLGGKRFRAVDDVSLAIAKGTTHAIVGESGSGKTTTVRAIVGYQRPTAGRVTVAGIELSSLSGEALRQFRRTVQLVYQNPFGSLDPRQDVREIIAEPLLNYERIPRAERGRRVEAILDRVNLPRAVLDRRPAALSGGQRQRVAIARALVLEPPILVLDEAVSALDVTVQAQILKLLDELQRDLALTYLFVSHDLAVVRQIASTVSVFRDGRIVESGKVEAVFRDPRDPYTRDLIAAVPGRRLPRHSLLAAE